jgi:hypothetical protein
MYLYLLLVSVESLTSYFVRRVILQPIKADYVFYFNPVNCELRKLTTEAQLHSNDMIARARACRMSKIISSSKEHNQ